MQTFVHVVAILRGKDRIDTDFWLNTDQIISILKEDGEVRCSANIGNELLLLVIDKRFTENINEILSAFIEPPKKPEIDW